VYFEGKYILFYVINAWILLKVPAKVRLWELIQVVTPDTYKYIPMVKLQKLESSAKL
jgi:hypothetical protein